MSSRTIPTAHPDLHPGDALYVNAHAGDMVHLGINPRDGVMAAGVIVRLVDFTDAVRDVLNLRLVPADAIVIERSALPLVEPLPSRDMIGKSLMVDGTVFDLDSTAPGYHRSMAYSRIALAEYLDARPRVDESAVDALQDALMTVAGHLPHRDAWREVATDLVRDGWHKDADR